MNKIISVANVKGGCGKSNLSVALFWKFVEEGIQPLYTSNDKYSPENLPLFESPQVQICDFGGFAPKSKEWKIINDSNNFVVVPTMMDSLSIEATVDFVENINNPNLIIAGTRATDDDVQLLKKIFTHDIFRFRNSTASPTSILEGKSPWELKDANPLLKRSWKGILGDVDKIFERII